MHKVTDNLLRNFTRSCMGDSVSRIIRRLHERCCDKNCVKIPGLGQSLDRCDQAFPVLSLVYL